MPPEVYVSGREAQAADAAHHCGAGNAWFWWKIKSEHNLYCGDWGARRHVSFLLKERCQSGLDFLVCKKQQPQGPWWDFSPVAQTVNVYCRGVGFRKEDLSWAVSGAEEPN